MNIFICFDVLLIILLLSLTRSILSCGITTHIEIGDRAATFFETNSHGINYGELIRKHAGSFQAGTVFPDAFYSNICFRGYYHSVSEDTHWTPFINATVNYIRENYPQPWNTAGEQLVVFLLGVVSHQVADVLWHSLDLQQGFLETMAMMNFNGIYSSAHSAADFGGDVINSYSLDNSQKNMIKNWYVPYNDLVKIYNELYGKAVIPSYVIRLCSYQLYLGRFGEQLGIIDSLYPSYSSKSPFLLDSLYSYFLGGMSDMAVWTALVWNRTVHMLDYGTQDCTLPKNPIFIRCGKEREPARKSDVKNRRRSISDDVTDPQKSTHGDVAQANRTTYSDAIKLKRNIHGDVTDAKRISMKRSSHAIDDYEALLGSVGVRKRSRYRRKAKVQKDVSFLANYSLLTSSQPYSEFGYCTVVGDVNSDGYLDALVSAPSYSIDSQMYLGKVFAIFGTSTGLNSENGTIEERANFSISGFHSGGRFGESIVLLDINKDGFLDVAVSSPSIGRQTLMYGGRVYVYLSNRGQIPSSPNVAIRCQKHHCNFGMRLASGDINGDGYEDLVVGSPMAPAHGTQRGMLQVLYADAEIGKNKIITDEEMDYSWYGNEDFEWFGYSHVFKYVGGRPLLVVGSPAYRRCDEEDCSYSQLDKQIAGRVHIYDLRKSFETPVRILEGSESFQQFGSYVNIVNLNNATRYTLIVSSTTADNTRLSSKSSVKQPGKVDFYELENWRKISTLYSNASFSRFGQSVIESRDFLYVAAPLLSSSFFNKREIGAVSVYKKTPQISFVKTISLVDNFARFASSLAILSANNSKYGNKKNQLIAGAPHHTTSSVRHSGAVVIATI